MINARTVLGVGVVLLILATSFMWLGCAGKPADSGKPAPAPAVGEEPTAASVTYVCPMHPDEKSQNPDDPCGICGMKLVPEDEVGDEPMEGGQGHMGDEGHEGGKGHDM